MPRYYNWYKKYLQPHKVSSYFLFCVEVQYININLYFANIPEKNILFIPVTFLYTSCKSKISNLQG